MPIIDYAKEANMQEKSVFNDPAISQKNKEYLKRFLDAYINDRTGMPISAARRHMFLSHIPLLLRATDDIKRDMKDPGKINPIFKRHRDRLSIPYYASLVNVSNRLVTWLNNGEKPKGFKNIKNVSKKSTRRNLSHDDMITWEDGAKIASMTNSVQFKAIIMTQLDGGFRPSEFVDLNYGDISIERNFIIAKVRNGKTGNRDVVLFKGVPYLQRWLQMHPSKKRHDPLWVIENPLKSHGNKKPEQRYVYTTIKKRIKILADMAKIEKPMDFYNLRHSACTISKLDNVNSGLAAQKFGHSVEYYEGTYGRLDTHGTINRFAKTYDVAALEKEKERNPLFCEICNTVNEADAEYCEKCGRPLTMQKALESHNEVVDLKKRMEEMDLKLMKAYTLMHDMDAARQMTTEMAEKVKHLVT